jgi:hypothetical protein
MELLSVIRRWCYGDHFSIREISRRTGLSRNTRPAPRTSWRSPRTHSTSARTRRRFSRTVCLSTLVILGLFFPRMAPLEMPSIPIVYQLLRSASHSTMALSEAVAHYFNTPSTIGNVDRFWSQGATQLRRRTIWVEARLGIWSTRI